MAAAAETLRSHGFAGSSARTIAKRGGFNQALIFYHYGGVNQLLVATLEAAAAGRLDVYRQALAEVEDIPTAVQKARRLYAEDVDGGHITVFAELIAGAYAVPELIPHVLRCKQPWVDFAEETITRLVRGTVLEPLVPPDQAARALVALYLGVELLDHLEPEAQSGAAVFDTGMRLLERLSPLLQKTRTRPAPSRRPVRVTVTSEEEKP